MALSLSKCLGLLGVLISATAAGGEPAADADAKPPIGVYESRHFVVHSDLTASEARRRAAQLEATLETISAYWGRPLRQRIECYLVDDLAVWPPGTLPHPLARILLERVGGGTDYQIVSNSSSKGEKGGPGRKAGELRQVRVFALATPGIAEHEVLHAYCSQVFGTGGPDWYKEGMAVMASYATQGPPEVHCPQEVVHHLRRSARRQVGQVVRSGTFTAPMSASFSRLSRNLTDDDQTLADRLPASRWGAADDLIVQNAQESYASSWALCHLMSHHPDFKRRFRRLGQSILASQNVSFERAFAGVCDEISFEYGFFLDHVDQGYRVDLCYWNWNKPFTYLKPDGVVRVGVKAAHGYQPSGLQVVRGKEYSFQVSGQWRTRSAGPDFTADGDHTGHGQLLGVVMHDYELSTAFKLGVEGSFTAPRTGRLYLRCQDAWNKLADNNGVVSVKLRRKTEG